MPNCQAGAPTKDEPRYTSKKNKGWHHESREGGVSGFKLTGFPQKGLTIAIKVVFQLYDLIILFPKLQKM